MNLQKRSVFIIALILFLALGINTAVLTYIASARYKQAILSKAASIGEGMKKEIEKVLILGVPVEYMEGMNEKLKGLLEDKSIDHALISDLNGKVLFSTDDTALGKELKAHASVKALSAEDSLIQSAAAFYDLSFPLREAGDKKVGVLRVAVKSEVINKQLYKLLEWALGISILSFLFFVSIVYFSVSK